MVVKYTKRILYFLSSVRSEEVAISAAIYNYNYYNLQFSHVMVMVIISGEDILIVKQKHPFAGVL